MTRRNTKLFDLYRLLRAAGIAADKAAKDDFWDTALSDEQIAEKLDVDAWTASKLRRKVMKRWGGATCTTHEGVKRYQIASVSVGDYPKPDATNEELDAAWSFK